MDSLPLYHHATETVALQEVPNLMHLNDFLPCFHQGCASQSFSVQLLNPPSRDQNVSCTRHGVANLAPNFAKKREMQKQNENTTMLNKQKRALCALKCWLNCPISGILRSSAVIFYAEKKKSTIHVVQCLIGSIQKRYPSKLDNFYVLSYHIGQTCRVKICWWSWNGAFF